MAGSAGPRPRQLILLAAFALAAGTAAAQSNANKNVRVPPAQQGNKYMENKRTGAPAQDAKSAQPDAALIEYLGEFDEAADGLDAMGLSDQTATPATASGSGH